MNAKDAEKVISVTRIVNDGEEEILEEGTEENTSSGELNANSNS